MAKPKSSGRPMRPEEVRRLRRIPPKGVPPEGLTTRIESQYLAFDKGVTPRLSTSVEHVRSVRDRSVWRFDVEVEGALADPRKLVPEVERRVVSRKILEGVDPELALDPYRPKFVGRSPVPKRFRLPRRRGVRTRSGKRLEPLYIFPPDGRYVYYDLDYPWRCAGRVWNNGGISTGVLVGPRHVLAASHALDWGAPWASFTANKFGFMNQGVANTWCVWYYEKIGSVNTENVDEDYVVCVLDKPLGNWLGWMGSKTYNDDWDDEPYWSNIGYAHDLGNANCPNYQAGIVLEEEDSGSMKAMTSTTGDFTEGHSGGPVFAWWDGWPYVIGVVSANCLGMNWVAGGVAMVRLIKEAREKTP